MKMNSSEFRKYFTAGDSLEEFELNLGEHKALHDLHYKKFSLSDEDIKRISLHGYINIIVITEPWCGDSLAILPVIKKMAEINGKWNVKVVFRDENTELIDHFLTLGGRAIPKILFLNDEFELLADWGPRPLKAMNIFNEHREDIREGNIKKSDVMCFIKNGYPG